jgi:hypothetical protein
MKDQDPSMQLSEIIRRRIRGLDYERQQQRAVAQRRFGPRDLSMLQAVARNLAPAFFAASPTDLGCAAAARVQTDAHNNTSTSHFENGGGGARATQPLTA